MSKIFPKDFIMRSWVEDADELDCLTFTPVSPTPEQFAMEMSADDPTTPTSTAAVLSGSTPPNSSSKKKKKKKKTATATPASSTYAGTPGPTTPTPCFTRQGSLIPEDVLSATDASDAIEQMGLIAHAILHWENPHVDYINLAVSDILMNLHKRGWLQIGRPHIKDPNDPAFALTAILTTRCRPGGASSLPPPSPSHVAPVPHVAQPPTHGTADSAAPASMTPAPRAPP